MYADGTGLLTYAMHDGRGADRFPSQCAAASVGAAGWHSRSVDAAACANHSCGAVAESHRASRAFRIGTKGWVERLAMKCDAAEEKKGEIQV